MLVTRYLIAASLFVFVSVAESSEPDKDWPRWRGPQDSGSTEFGAYPVKFDAVNDPS